MSPETQKYCDLEKKFNDYILLSELKIKELTDKLNNLSNSNSNSVSDSVSDSASNCDYESDWSDYYAIDCAEHYTKPIEEFWH